MDSENKETGGYNIKREGDGVPVFVERKTDGKEKKKTINKKGN